VPEKTRPSAPIKFERFSPRVAVRARRQRLLWLIDLSRADATTLLSSERPGDLLNICAILFRCGFLVPRINVPPDLQVQRLAQRLRDTPGSLETLIKELCKITAAVADGGNYALEFQPGSKLMLDGHAVKANEWAERQKLWSPPSDEGLIQAVVFGAIFLFSTDEAAMVRRCVREKCKRVFLAIRPKQRFCSKPCASATAFERYKTEKGEDVYKAEHRKVAKLWYRRNRKRLGRRKKEGRERSSADGAQT
jgi:hypothetical protein